MIRAKSMEEAIAWANRCPGGEGDAIEIRQVQESGNFPTDVREAASDFAALRGKSATAP